MSSLVGAVHGAIVQLSVLLTPAAGDLAVALAIVLFTLLVRLVISPLSYLQVRTERRRRALAPQVAQLREKHGDDPMTLAAETLALQRANGAGPLTGLLPGLAQAPFFLIMYRVALDAPAGVVLGVPLSAHLLAGLPVFALLLALSAVFAWWLGRCIEGPAVLRLLPWLSLVAVAWMPLAGALYLVTSTGWTVLERLVWRRGVTTGKG
jgi:YidC/Oxa1 family membrane protein insertase